MYRHGNFLCSGLTSTPYYACICLPCTVKDLFLIKIFLKEMCVLYLVFFTWANAKATIRFKSLHIDEGQGGPALPNMKQHCYGAQMRLIVY